MGYVENKGEKSVHLVAQASLLAEANSKKKTCDLTFPTKFTPQNYLLSYRSDVATVIFKLRGRSVNCLANRGSDGVCRLCGHTKETQEHAINCPEIVDGGEFLNLNSLYGDVPLDDVKIREIVFRFLLYEEKLLAKVVKVGGDGDDN